jgi:hypothetical protein
MIELTPEQHQALSETGSDAVDPATNSHYVLVRAEVYNRLRQLDSEDKWVDGASAASMEVFARDGWDDPRMDVYDSLVPRERQ